MTQPTSPTRHLNHHEGDTELNSPILVDWPGKLYYLPGFLTPAEQEQALRHIDADQWNTQIYRRTQHFGWRYDYKAKAITPDMYLGQLPEWLDLIARKLAGLTDAGKPLFNRKPQQCIVNEYLGAQGIAQHTDHRGFGPSIATISLLEDWEMDLKKQYRNRESRPALLQRGSVLLMTGPSRSVWSHGIAPKTREHDGRRRGRRISLTFRTVLNQDGPND